MKMLAIDAAAVPVVYRVRVQDGAGQLLADDTSFQCLPTQIGPAVERVRAVFASRDGVTVTYWEA